MRLSYVLIIANQENKCKGKRRKLWINTACRTISDFRHYTTKTSRCQRWRRCGAYSKYRIYHFISAASCRRVAGLKPKRLLKLIEPWFASFISTRTNWHCARRSLVSSSCAIIGVNIFCNCSGSFRAFFPTITHLRIAYFLLSSVSISVSIAATISPETFLATRKM